MTLTVEQTEAALRAAYKVLRDAEAAQRAEIEAAKAEIEQRNLTAIAAAQAVVAACEKDVNAAKEAAGGHPWEGRKVQKIEPTGRVWSRGPDRTITGVIEVRRRDTRFPTNKRWGLPDIGHGFVRLLKKDGTPGSTFGTLSSWKPWRLVDEPNATPLGPRGEPF